jgi:peptide/nickel transport system substrate-binding protein
MRKTPMRRRDFLATSIAAAGALAAPNLARGADARVLRFVPQANLPNLDPVWGTQYVVRNASLLVFDTLFGIDSTLTPRPQICEGYEVSSDGKIWTFRLREGLKFHDGTPVRAQDAVASLSRWMARDTMGQLIHARLDAIEATDDRNIRMRLAAPFPKMLFALSKGNPNLPAIMPERLAATDPFKQIAEFIGSGPMRFAKDEWVPGSKAVFTRFDLYAPRSEPADWLAGGKRMNFDRIEWQIIPDAATAAAALQSGEIDWWETPLPDLVPLLKQSADIRVDIADPLGNVGILRMNHLYPPFNDVRLRQALQMVVNQPDYMRAVVGNDDALWKSMPSFITPGTPLYTEAGGDVLSGPRNIPGARKQLAEAGYGGEKVVMLVATDLIITKGQGDVSADVMTKAGFNVDYVATDWGTVGARRAKKDPPDKGGWNIFHTWLAGVDCINPAPNIAIRTNGAKAWFGWPENRAIETMIAEWYAAPDLGAEKQVIEKINRASMEFVTFIPTGFFYGYQAWRRNVSGIVKAPFPVFWDVKKG